MKQMLVSNQNGFYYREQDPQYMGQSLHPELIDGPTQQRKCRDMLFLLLYVAFWGGLIVIAVIGFRNGRPWLLAAPFDSAGFQCGYSEGYEEYKYGYFHKTNYSRFACITKCPKNGLFNGAQCIWNGSLISCQDFGSNLTVTIVNFCFPLDDNFPYSSVTELGLSFYDEGISDLKSTWQVSLSIVFLTFICSLILLLFIRLCGTCLVISIIFVYFFLIITIGVIFLLSADGSISILNFINDDGKQMLKILAYISFTIAGISLFILICSIKKIKMGIIVIKLTAEFSRQKYQSIVVPIIMFIVMGLFFTFWISVSIYIFSSGEVSSCRGMPFACIKWNIGVKRSLLYYFFGLFWNCQVAIGMCQFVIASTTAYWYFGKGSGKKVSNPVCRSFCRGLVYHLGSIALGALIICVLLMLQIAFEILHGIGKKQSISGDPLSNACTRCCINYIRCMLACFQRFVRFISRNAFIMMAISGDGFCSAAHEAFYLVLRTSQVYVVSHGIGYLIMFFGKLLVCALCTFIGYLMVTQIEYFSEEVFNPVMPTIVLILIIQIFFVISFAISSLFMDVFGIGSDTLLLCYCIERDILKGSTRACPKELVNVIQN